MDYAHRFSCHRCGGGNDLHHKVSSTPDVEARANEIADLLEPLCRTRGRMLGVMTADDRWIVCLSGGASVAWQFIRMMRDYDPSIAAIAHDWATVPKRSLGGHDIGNLLVPLAPGGHLRHFLRQKGGGVAGGPGCWCAAPKLVSYLTQDAGSRRLPPSGLALFELWCGKATGTRRHRQPAESCANCKLILPTLMCRNPR
jgi:hypothetical protein